MNLITAINKPVEGEMSEFARAFVETLQTDNPLLKTINDFVLQKTGKKLRPLIVFLCAKLCGEPNLSTVDAALSLELLHTASLIHDDVVDDTLERRGKPSINARWSNKIAVLAGDYILSKSLCCGVRTRHLAMLEAISNIGLQLSDGEMLQLAGAPLSAESEKNYYNIIRKKTALLFATCAEVGALSVNASPKQVASLKLFGEYLGLCFQIKDDIFDYSDDVLIGKPTGNDIRDGKVTLPLIYALQNSEGEAKRQVLSWLDSKEFTPQIVASITQFAIQNGGVVYAEKQMNYYKELAFSALDVFQNNNLKQALMHCVEYAISRTN